ncbi:MAG: O-methyltransferase [Firmicutes bacterium]|nr:O-methyltransferase [Bacillota bacterium]
MENNDKHNISYEYISRYIGGVLEQSTGLLRELELYAEKNNIPIAPLETIRFIQTLLLATQPKRILEVGAAIGYSAITMAKCGGNITTIERDKKMAELLKQNIEKAGLLKRITVLKGDAADILPTLTEQFDFIFLDAAKGHYIDFLPDCIRLLKDGGLLCSDNVLYKGMVATDELVIRRKITIVRRLRSYLKTLCENDRLTTSVIPIGDGLALSCKGREQK